MSIVSNRSFRVVVELIHGLSAGAYPGAVLGVWLVRVRVGAMLPSAIPLLEKTAVWLWLVLVVCSGLLVITGGIRLRYWQLNIRQGFLPAKRRMIAIKHTAFVLVLLATAVWMFTLLPS